MKTSFWERLTQGPLVADGAMGTMLMSRGASPGSCLEALNLQAPEMVRGVHEDYRLAGAEILQTNTFGASAVRLAAHGLADQVTKLNAAAVAIARQAAGEDVWVAGAVGPLGAGLNGGMPASPMARDAREVFREQIVALVAAGADMILLETFSDLTELTPAVRVAREFGERIPVIVQMTLDARGNLRGGVSLEFAAGEAARAGADIVGINCCDGPQSVFRPLQKLLAESDVAVIVQPSAGVPTVTNGATVHPCSPREFGEWAARLFDAGASIVGGCCGTTPGHIRQVTEARDSRKWRTRRTAASRV